MKKTITITMLLVFMLVISCANMSGGEKGALTGAGIGALGGAALTAIAGGNAAVGAAIGGAAGAVAGGIIGGKNEEKKEEHRLRPLSDKRIPALIFIIKYFEVRSILLINLLTKELFCAMYLDIEKLISSI